MIATKSVQTFIDGKFRDSRSEKTDPIPNPATGQTIASLPHSTREEINEAVKDLDKDPSLDEAKRKRVQGYVKNVAKLTDATHDAADEKNLAETKKQETRLKTQVDLLEKQFGKPVKTQIKKQDSASQG